jgi:sodium-dependent dicarboxylate transporter 2/3/5
MLLPAALAVISQVEGSGKKLQSALAVPLLLGLAYASSIGGTASLIGTLPNMVLKDFVGDHFPDHVQIDFANWIMFGLPVSLVFLVICFFVIKFIFFRNQSSEEIDMAKCRAEYNGLGKMGYEEIVLSISFILTVLLWLTMNDKTIGSFEMRGWTSMGIFENKYIKESTIAMLMAGILFIIPSLREKGRGIISWQEVKRIPIGIIFLFGGGFALAAGVSASGLSDWLAGQLSGIGNLPPILIVFLLCLFTTFFTELTSNTTSTILLLTILLSVVKSLDVHPLLVLLPVTISASYAFMLPVATPPNTIVFASEKIKVKDMMRAGIWLNLIGAVVITIATFTMGRWVFGI